MLWYLWRLLRRLHQTWHIFTQVRKNTQRCQLMGPTAVASSLLYKKIYQAQWVAQWLHVSEFYCLRLWDACGGGGSSKQAESNFTVGGALPWGTTTPSLLTVSKSGPINLKREGKRDTYIQTELNLSFSISSFCSRLLSLSVSPVTPVKNNYFDNVLLGLVTWWDLNIIHDSFFYFLTWEGGSVLSSQGFCRCVWWKRSSFNAAYLVVELPFP